MLQTLNAGWFSPELTTAAATEEFLQGQEDGTFVVRFSGGEGFVFTIAVAGGCQTRIARSADEPGRLIVSHPLLSGRSFASLPDLITSPFVQNHLHHERYWLKALSLGGPASPTPIGYDSVSGMKQSLRETIEELQTLDFTNSNFEGED